MNVVHTSTESLRRSLRQTANFLYRHSASLVIVSVCWFVGSLPVVTSGPATLGAYSAIRSIRDNGRLRPRDVCRTLRHHGLNATLLSFVPVIVGVLTAIYFYQYVITDATQYVVLSIVGIYLFLFLSLVLLTTFVHLSDGCAFVNSIKDSYAWVIHNPLLSTMTILASGAIFLIGVISVVGIVIIIPAVLFSFHAEVIQNSSTPTTGNSNQ